MNPSEFEILQPIRDIEYLQKLIDMDYTLKGQRTDPSRNLTVFKRFLKKGHEFIPENWLKNKGYIFVEPCTFTKGYKLAYKIKDGKIEQYFESNYSLNKNDNEIHLFLRCVK
jgi:hypothetical protein